MLLCVCVSCQRQAILLRLVYTPNLCTHAMNRCISPGVEGVYVSKQKRRRVVQPDEFCQTASRTRYDSLYRYCARWAYQPVCM